MYYIIIYRRDEKEIKKTNLKKIPKLDYNTTNIIRKISSK